MDVSVTTVLQAYLVLESRGLIEARPQSGYYVKIRMEKLAPDGHAQFLESGGYDRHLRRLRKSLAAQVQSVSLVVSRYFPQGTRVTRPVGGFVLWVELPKSVNSLELHRKALREKISISPGPIFSAKQEYQNCIRLSCGQPWSGKLEQAIVTLGKLAGQA